MTMLTGADREKERDQITRPLNWPCFPLLPVKRATTHEYDLGVIYWWHSQDIEDGGEVIVYFTNMFDFKHTKEHPAIRCYDHKIYSDLDAFFDDGWRGD